MQCCVNAKQTDLQPVLGTVFSKKRLRSFGFTDPVTYVETVVSYETY